MEPELRDLLRRMARDVSVLRSYGGLWHAFFEGLVRGAGWIIGSILAIALAGWILYLLGAIPGLGELARHLYAILQNTR